MVNIIKNSKPDDKIIIYENTDGNLRIFVRIENETVWLSQKQMAELFDCNTDTIGYHLKNTFKSGELDKKVVSEDSSVTTQHGAIAGKTQTKSVKLYSLDAIISVGYRVNSIRGTQFRIWATKRLKEYIIKGFTMDDERLKESGGGNYWKELLDRIRDIRSSEKVLYRQVLDLYATSIDYDAKSLETIRFFKTVQNKLHYATNKYTAAETIYDRVDAKKEFLGLTTFKGEIPVKSDISIAKNYLTEDELFRLNRLVSAFFDLAEIRAQEHTKIYMKDWISELDKFSKIYGKGTLSDKGRVSHEQAIEKAEKEYKKYQVKTLSPVEKAYLESIKNIEKQVSKKLKTIKSDGKNNE